MKRVIFDAATDGGGYFSSEFRNYVRDQKLLCEYLLLSSVARTTCLFRHDEQADGVDSTRSDLTNMLINICVPFPYALDDSLVQFWKAQELGGERRVLLTTHNQPFLVRGSFLQMFSNVTQGICSYRMGTDNIIIGEVGGGIIGRVYQSKRFEYSPDIGFYSSEEYPNRDFAVSCGIKSSLAIPIADSFGRLVGVLEVVMQSIRPPIFLKPIILELQRGSNLRCLDHCKDLCGKAKSFGNALSEIEKGIKVIGKVCGLLCAQTWIICNHCGSLSTCERLQYIYNYSDYYQSIRDFVVAQHICGFHLKKGEGVVGKAALSPRNLVYCEDVSQFSLTQYPMAHCARRYELTSCFAIPLKSDLSQSEIYVLEFFLDPQKVNTMDLEATLVPILEAIKLNFPTFKDDSGEEIGDNLSVQVIEFAFGEGIGDNLSVQVIDTRSPTDKIVPLRVRKRDFISAFGMNNNEGCTDGTDDPSTELEAVYSASTVQCECRFTVEVNYEDRLYTFPLFSSSGIHELNWQLYRRLNLEDGTYDVIYLDDDNDRILLTCTDDLREYIENSMKQEKYTLMMKIEPK